MSAKCTMFARHALLPNGWASNVRLSWDDGGALTQIETGAQLQTGERVESYVLPGMTNLHSHAFQRAMAGMTELAGEGPDSFWTWRDLMYRFALAITPEQMQAIAAQLYSECLRYGYTSVCEFHYLHRAPDGSFYGNRAEMAERVIAAAQEVGMGISMLPVLYSFADFKDQPLRHDQRRFSTNVDEILGLISDLEKYRSAKVEIGVAPHSLRAANVKQIQELVKALPKQRPIHIHIAEQMREVEASLSATGQRPVELLLNTQEVDQRWCLVHATHLTSQEVQGIAKQGAVAGICTTTEGNLGDGFFELPEFIEAGGVFGIGSDSHVSQSAVEEIRWLEYGQRLRSQKRNVASVKGQRHVADFLWNACLQGGAQAAARAVGGLQAGYRADFLVLDDEHPNLQDLPSDLLLSSFIFSGNDNVIRDVYVSGEAVVQQGRHVHQDRISKNFKRCMRELRSLS
ncbi:formimidoylglutamate deiminase [Undibacterium sp. LX40W]|uniref:Formimidoylglutamate deiminase n=1 Tax=Undibacterium nitidum TaxID=2762298 RepID=A0A923HRF5_9BURK|nr:MULTISPECIES: formimidoylglutamate deiminase [Undibacterium]MBC3881107.1 formimidoylglutamate deiminase [Undibacterium nitidum]MBC3890160.1 formimidoylglutamate deiminase [Undibacterium sp. LX40W]